MQDLQTTETSRQPAAAGAWPEALRDKPRPADPFPTRVFLTSVLPGVIIALVLLALVLYLELRASRQVLYLTPRGTLAAVRADGQGARDLSFAGLPDLAVGAPHWSPDDRSFAAPARWEGKEGVLVASPQGANPRLLEAPNNGRLLLSHSPWSDDGTLLAFAVREEDDQGELVIASVPQGAVLATGLTIDPQANLDWRPGSNELLVTARTDAMTPTLYIVGGDGQPRVFAPQDSQVSHMDAAWSPDGRQVAYVAGNDVAEPAGALFVASGDATGARVVVQEGLNFAPVWAPRGDLLFFTRHVTETGEYELYRVRPDGQELRRIGVGTPAWRALGTDRSTLLDWSPDGSQLFFQGFEGGRAVVYRALYDGGNTRPLTAEAGSDALVVRWMPTSRALLIADSSRSMSVHWVDEERPPQRFPSGWLPAVQ